LQPKVPANDGWQEIVNPIVSCHRGWPNFSLPRPPLFNPNVHISHVDSPVQSSHASKRLKNNNPLVQDKGNVDASPSSPSNDSSKSVSSHMHLKDDCFHVISEMQPQGSNQPHANSGKSKVENIDKIKLSS
jgi:hypothetical protein